VKVKSEENNPVSKDKFRRRSIQWR